jgi:GNAT superfamily N-acetyltransferase
MRPVSSATACEIRGYRPEDEAGVLGLLAAALGEGPTGDRTVEFFRWKHLENPFGPSYVLVAEADGRIVGLRAFMRWRFRVDGREVRAVRAVDTATHPDYQGRGIFSRLTRQALDELSGDVDLVFNTPNAKSLAGYVKMGWQSVGRIDVDLRTRRPLRVLRAVRHLESTARPSHARPESDAETAAVALLDPGVAPLVASVAATRARLITARSVDFLAWRYAAAPGLDYRAVRESVGRRLTGLAFFRIRPRGPLWETTIADVIVPAGDWRTARRLLRRVVRSAPVDHVSCRLPRGTPFGRAVRAAGFVRWGQGPVLTVKTMGDIGADPTARSSWDSIGVGDLEVF